MSLLKLRLLRYWSKAVRAKSGFVTVVDEIVVHAFGNDWNKVLDPNFKYFKKNLLLRMSSLHIVAPGTNPIKILHRKFYATLFFLKFWLDAKIVQPVKKFEKIE